MKFYVYDPITNKATIESIANTPNLLGKYFYVADRTTGKPKKITIETKTPCVPNANYYFIRGNEDYPITVPSEECPFCANVEEFDDDMVLTYDTTKSSGTTIGLPFTGNVDVTVDWGDSSQDSYTTDGVKEHTYASEGTYEVRISGTLERFGDDSFGRTNDEKLVGIKSFGIGLGLTSLHGSFVGHSIIDQLPKYIFPITVSNLRNAFANPNVGSFDSDLYANKQYPYPDSEGTLATPEINDWDVSNVVNFSACFYGQQQFNSPLNNWDVSNATDPDRGLRGVFWNCRDFNQPLDKWNTANITMMDFMFNFATGFNQDVSMWDIKNAINMQSVFANTFAFNQKIMSKWDFLNATNINDIIFKSGVTDNFENTHFPKVTTATGLAAIGKKIERITNFNRIRFPSLAGSDSFSGMTSFLSGRQLLEEDKDFYHNITGFINNLPDTMNGINFDGALAERRIAKGISFEDFDLSKLGIIERFLEDSTISVKDYNKTLIGWADFVKKNDGPFNKTWNPSLAKYSDEEIEFYPAREFTNAVDARNYLTTSTGSGGAGWTITDAGLE